MRRSWLIENFDLGWRENHAHAINELESIFLRPKVDVERVKFVMIFVLVRRIIGRQMPLALVNCVGDSQGYHAVLLVRVPHSGLVEESIKCVLVVSAGVVRDLNATSPLIRIFKQVYVGALIESMVAWLDLRRTIEVVNISEAGVNISLSLPLIVLIIDLQRSYILFSWPRGHLDKSLRKRKVPSEAQYSKQHTVVSMAVTQTLVVV